MSTGSDGSTATDAQSSREVTFAFTDIEGSTTRWERDRLAMRDAVRRHDTILQTAIAEHDGHVFKTIGDAFCAAFARPQDAVAAMLAAQQALAAEDFSVVDGLRVRAAIHTGNADKRGGDYFGPALNKVARLLAIGHGGQILLTAETVALVDGALPVDASLRNLGAYHLKDFNEPQQVYQLFATGLPSNFPPLRSLGTLPSDLAVVDSAAFHPIPSFSGRDRELVAVQAALDHDGAIAVLHGLGGMGKSSIAREYGWRNRKRYSVVWWLNAQTEDGIVDGLLRLGTMFAQGLEQLADRHLAAQRLINSVLAGFDKPVLLVFDNLEDEGLMRKWLPRTGARALATSREAVWAVEITAIALETWSFETAVEYLQRASGRADLRESDARAIAQTLGALPLALAHAAAALRNMRMVSAQRYLAHITEHLKNAPRGAEYPKSVFATFSTAIAQAEQHAAGAAAVLCFAASFAPDAIPDELFHQPIECYAEGLRPALADGVALDLRSAIADELRLDEALGTLDRLSLLTFSHSPHTYSMHRLVQLIARTYNLHRLVQRAARDLTGDADAWRTCAVAVAVCAFPKVEFDTWPQCERLLPHARAALDALPHDAGSLPAAELAFRCGLYLRERAEYSAAEVLHMQALEIREKILGPDHADVAASLTNVAIAVGEQGRHAEAAPLFERALKIREQAFGPDDPRVAQALVNLGYNYDEQGRLAEEEALHTRALAIWENALGPEHPHTAFAVTNLAHVYMMQRRYAEAEPLQRRALAIRERALEAGHPHIAVSLNNLADAFRCQGRYAEAEPLLARALAIRENALGKDHPNVASVLDTLANLYCDQARYTEAKPFYERALEIRDKSLGPDHPSTKSTREALYALRNATSKR